MEKKYYIVLDLEWNQSTLKCNEVSGIPFEILEIGAIKLDENKKVIDTYRSYVKPQIYRTLHFMTMKVVHFELNKLKKERPFPIVIKEFLKWCGDDFVLCTWGSNDLTELQRNMKYYKIKPLSKGPLKYLDIQKLFSLKYLDGKKRLSLKNAVTELKIEEKDEFHGAFADAKYTAMIFIKLDDIEVEDFYSIDCYCTPKKKDNELYIDFPNYRYHVEYTKYISRIFKNKYRLMEDEEVSKIYCNICKCKLHPILDWFTTNGGRFFIAVGKCRKHGYIKLKVRVKKSENDRVYAVKTIRRITEEEFEQFNNLENE